MIVDKTRQFSKAAVAADITHICAQSSEVSFLITLESRFVEGPHPKYSGATWKQNFIQEVRAAKELPSVSYGGITGHFPLQVFGWKQQQ